MNDLVESKKYLKIGIAAFFILFVLIALRICIKLNGNDFLGISALAVILLLGGILCTFIFISCICTWVYKDSASRGENGLLWALIVLVTTPFVGLIIYFISRKEEKITCKSCKNQIIKNANYCEHCGVENKNKEEYIMLKTIKSVKLIVAGVIAAVLMIGCFTAFTVLAFTSDSFVDKTVWNKGIISMSNENKIGNEWTLKFKSASDGFRKRDTLKIEDDSQILFADIECAEGELLLHIEQGDKKETIDVSNIEQPIEYSLQDFQAGKITVILEVNGAKNVDSFITIK